MKNGQSKTKLNKKFHSAALRDHNKRHELPQRWPEPPINLVLVEPQIPPNTGAVARLCAATGTCLHLVEPLGFRITDRSLKRAGLDYWNSVEIVRHHSLAEFLSKHSAATKYYFSTSARKSYTEIEYKAGDMLVFGSETQGLPRELLDANPRQVHGIPMIAKNVRSLNLAASAAIVVYEALRQFGSTD